MHHLIDFVTKKPVKAEGLVFTGEDSPWEVVMDMDTIKSKINLDYFKIAPPGVSKYLPLMPIKEIANFVSLREIATPLIKSKVLGERLNIELYFKVEGKNPTGSFKDRGSAVDISIAKELGASSVILASTGNMAASCACYAATAKIPCFILVPEGVSVSKLAQVIAYGGRIIQIKGNYNDAATLAHTIASKMGFYLAGDYAYRVEGQKTAAFEVIDQMFFQTPDIVIIPIGCGTNITAYAKGFNEYRQLGLIDRLPQLVGVEATGAAAVVNSFEKNSNIIEPLTSADTLASAIAVPNPIDGIKALDAIYSTNGFAAAVSDQDMLEAQHLLSTEEGLFVESASAATYAALAQAVASGKIPAGKKVVCVLTGDGLKDAHVVLKAAIKPATIYPDEKEFALLYENNFFNSKSMIFVDKNKILFNKAPTLEQIKAEALSLLNAQYSDEYLQKIKIILDKILQKGKVITVSDFQDSVQDALETLRHRSDPIFSVLDFDVTTGKDRAAHAKVKIKISGETREASAQGVGPVDAVISALTLACKEQINFKLTEYKVEIRNQGVDAVVYVELKLMKDRMQSLGCGTSPDIIQASIEAFEEAYNGF
jgi:threonine synthase